MDRSGCRGRAVGWRAVCALLLAVGGLAACGTEPFDAAPAERAVSESPARPEPPAPPGGACRRWTTCVPENPCHTGWVTGCRANVPICTDIGGWLSNGTACGTDAVCYMGECEPCAVGQACPIFDMYGNPDACNLGAIACGSGQPVCEYQGPAPDGTSCGGGGPYFCKEGLCGWCDEGYTGCQLPDLPCHVGVLTQCATTGGTCTDSGLQPPGAACGYDRVCTSGGDCVACTWYATCTPPPQPPTSCIEQSAEGYTYCSDGPSCVPYSTWWKPDGTPCGDGVCQSGTCVMPCIPDQPCTPPYDACRSGRTVCWGAYGGYCEPGDPLPDGTSCGYELVCSEGSCVSCGPAASCYPGPCHETGTLSCVTGRCEPQPPPLDDGLACGVGGEICQAGTCTPVPGADPWVRSTYGAVDLAGTTWVNCMTGEPEPGMSRLRVETYVAGGITHRDVYYTSGDCTGAADPAGLPPLVGAIESGGDRLATWEDGWVPPGLPWALTATAMHVTAPVTPEGPLELKLLVFVDDAVSPRQLYTGESKSADFYPSQLKGSMPMFEVLACDAGAPCSPGYATCEVFQIDCSVGVPICTGTGTFLADGTRCADGHSWCQAGACVPVPTRTVSGTALLTYWPDSGPVATTDPVPLGWIAALQFPGGFTYHPGTIYPDGSFEIPNVEVTRYLVEVGLPWLQYFENVADTLDLGMDLLGRRDVAWPTGPTPVGFDVKGLVPWVLGDILEFASSNAGVAALPFGGQESPQVPEGLDALAGTLDWYGRPLVSGAAGDVAYVMQASTAWAPTGERITAASRWKQLPGTFEIVDGAGGVVDVILDPCTEFGTVSADWRRSAFEAYQSMVHPDATIVTHRLTVGARPHAAPSAPGFRVGELAAWPGLPLLTVHVAGTAGDVILDGVPYGRFLPPLWREYRHDRLMYGVNLTYPGATRSVRLGAPVGHNVAAERAPAVVAPLLSPPGSLRIAGLDAWSGVSGVGTQPRITWTAPAVSPDATAVFPGATLRYTVTVYEVQPTGDGGTRTVALFAGTTTRTTFSLPGTNMYYGGRYVVAVRAMLSTVTLDAPLHEPYEQAYATVVSREFTP